MNVGAFVYCTTQGLGILAKSFFDNGVVNKPCIHLHHCRKNNTHWYPEGTPRIDKRLGYRIAHEWLKTIDVLLVFETPFDWTLIPTAKRLGIPVVFMPMYECTPQVMPHEPDRWICPSVLDYDYFKSKPDCRYIPVPVSVPWKLRTEAKVFVHNAGNGGLLGRNGTRELVNSLKYIKSDAQIIIRGQEFNEEFENEIAKVSSNVDVHYSSGTIPYDKLWEDGDVFVFPEKFNGLSLPLQEARAAGMAVAATDRRPNNLYLPLRHLIQVSGYNRARVGVSYLEFDEAIVNPLHIANRIDEMYGQDISDVSYSGQEFAKTYSWENLKPQYMEAFSL